MVMWYRKEQKLDSKEAAQQSIKDGIAVRAVDSDGVICADLQKRGDAILVSFRDKETFDIREVCFIDGVTATDWVERRN